MLLGRTPGFASGPAVVGPWRDVTVERRTTLAVDDLQVRARPAGTDGIVEVAVQLRALDGTTVSAVTAEISGPSGEASVRLACTVLSESVHASGKIELKDIARWWPHTHGTPALYEIRLRVGTNNGEVRLEAGRVGFRDISPGPPGHDVLTDGLDLRVNGVAVFARGAVWSPLDLVGMAPTEEALRRRLLLACGAGMNMIRIAGTGAYESPTFHDLCDELGLLVWQDFMFANFDYPVTDPDFRKLVEAEVRSVLVELSRRPSLTVLCGNSEVEQQAAMTGRGAEFGRGELFGEIIPRLIRETGTEVIYVPSAPCGVDLPFRPDQGIANYYGVGGYRRPLSDVRISAVRFAAECLAFANLPDLPHAAATFVPRDVGAAWDFADVRDHYLEALYAVDVKTLRRDCTDRYLELSRATSGEVMAQVFGEWRREASPCGGALVLSLGDLEPGAGWGVLDDAGNPKVAYHHLRRALAPLAIWLTDEGLAGLDVHIANDTPTSISARIRVAFYRDRAILVDEARCDTAVPAHTTRRWSVEALLGRFVDASYAYRFGPPNFDLVVATLERAGGGSTAYLSQAVFFPEGRPAGVEAAERVGLTATGRWCHDDLYVAVKSDRYAHGVRIRTPGFEGDDDAFPIEPGGTRTIHLRGTLAGAAVTGQVTAVNLAEPIAIDFEQA